MAALLISTMGLFWKEDWVFWGRQKNIGALWGVSAKKLTSQPINFRDQVGIYVLYSNYNIVYVGQSGKGDQKLFIRLRQHRFDDLAGRWNQFSWFGTRRVLNGGKLSAPTDAQHPTLATTLNVIEGILLHAAEPPLNRQKGRFGNDVIRYIQVRDEKIGLTEKEMLEELYKVNGINPHRSR